MHSQSSSRLLSLYSSCFWFEAGRRRLPRHLSSYSSDTGPLKSITTTSTSKPTSTQHSRLTCCRSALESSASQFSRRWDYSSEEDDPLNRYCLVARYSLPGASLEQRAHQ